MEKLKFRKLKADEIDVRIGTLKYENPKDKNSKILGASFLLYKDARVDMAMLDEVVGAYNWQRMHEFKDGKLYCSVGIRREKPDGFGEWVWKEDVGVESNTEAEKGQASDAFKRACFNWGIGRELYTSPFIYLTPMGNEDIRYLKLRVALIEYENDTISKLELVDNKGKVRFTFNINGKTQDKTTTENVKTDNGYKAFEQTEQSELDPNLLTKARDFNVDVEGLKAWCKKKHNMDLTNEILQRAIDKKIASLNVDNGE